MKVGLQTWGSEGDLRPFFALSEGLAKAGHEVELLYTTHDDRDVSDRLAQAPYRHRRVGSLGLTPQERASIATRIFADPNPVRQFKSIVTMFLDPVLPAMTEAALELAASSDVVVHHLVAHSASAAAEKLKKPWVSIHFAPLLATRFIPVPGTPHLGLLNRLAWKLALSMIDRNLLPSVSRVRASIGLPPVKRVRDHQGASALDLLAVSPSLLSRPADWDEKVRICGFFNLATSAAPGSMPEGLEAFLAGQPPPVFVTFGSMASVEQDPSGLFQLVTGAIEQAGCRAIVQGMPSDLPEHPLIFRIGAAPHDELFPRCAAIVHHGGAGTTQSAVRAGRPSVIVAHITDQFLFGRVLYKHGVAPPHLTRRGLTAKKLAAALKAALAASGMPRAAAALGEKLRAEDGVATAVRLIEGL